MKNFKFNIVANIDDNSVEISKEILDGVIDPMFPTRDLLQIDMEFRKNGEFVWGIKSPTSPIVHEDDEGRVKELMMSAPMLAGAVTLPWIEPSDFERSRIEEAMPDEKIRGAFAWSVARRGLIDYLEDEGVHVLE